MARAFAEIAFTPAVRAEQARQGSAGSYAKFLDAEAAARDSLGAAEAALVAERHGFYQATDGETGWPYVQFRVGPPGFHQVLAELPRASANFRGTPQTLRVSNLRPAQP